MIKSFGVISIAVTYFAIAIVTLTHKRGASYSISKHAVSDKKTYITMALLETVLLSMFFMFIALWFTPQLHLSAVFTAIVLVSALGLLAAGWVPDTKGVQHKVHEFCAYGAFLLFIPALSIIMVSPQISLMARLFGAIAFVYMITVVLLFSLVEKVKDYHLYYQVVYMAMFHATILLAAYTSVIK